MEEYSTTSINSIFKWVVINNRLQQTKIYLPCCSFWRGWQGRRWECRCRRPLVMFPEAFRTSKLLQIWTFDLWWSHLEALLMRRALLLGISIFTSSAHSAVKIMNKYFLELILFFIVDLSTLVAILALLFLSLFNKDDQLFYFKVIFKMIY